ncbi:MAG TPA: DUF2784 domain-containing protein [Terracidiphilus sp.]|nr:DUF2784 domain-containing protein [Terracidiphilus sp.]
MIGLAIAAVAVHAVWLLGVIFGAVWTRGRRVWSVVHVAALVWGIVAEVGPWPCPLTVAEEYFETRAGAAAYHGSFVLHYLEAIVYPNLPGWVVAGAGVAVCGLNLGIYGWRFLRYWRRKRSWRS